MTSDAVGVIRKKKGVGGCTGLRILWNAYLDCDFEVYRRLQMGGGRPEGGTGDPKKTRGDDISRDTIRFFDPGEDEWTLSSDVRPAKAVERNPV